MTSNGNMSTSMFEHFLSSFKEAIIMIDHNWTIRFINKKAEVLFDVKTNIIGKNIWSEMAESIRPYYEFYLNHAFEEDKITEFDHYYQEKAVWLKACAYPSEQGLTLHIKEQSNPVISNGLKESIHYDSLFKQNPDPVFSVDREGNYLSANDSFIKASEYSMDEIIQLNFSHLIHQEDLERVSNHFKKSLTGFPQVYETRCLTKYRKLLFIQIKNIPIIDQGEVIGVYGVVKDVTEQKKAEATSKQRETNLRLAMKIAKLGSWEWDVLNNVITLSEEHRRIIDLGSTSQLTFEEYMNYIHPSDRDYVQKNIEETFEGKPLNIDFRMIRSNGQMRYVEAVGEAFFNKIGQVYKVIGTTKDVTDRKFDQEKLRKSEELYNLITENSHDVIIFINSNRHFTYVSPAIKNLLGYEPENLIGRRGLDFIHPEDLEKLYISKEIDYYVSTSRYLHRNGHYVWVELSRKLIKDENGEVDKFLIIARDVTKRLEAEELMIKSEKLSLAGQLAAGIAHEVRNPLTAIKGFLQMMSKGYEMKAEYLEVIDVELTRIETILSELLLLAKPQSLKFKNHRVSSIIIQVVTLLETESNLKNVVLKIEQESNDFLIHCDENQMKQVFINFIKNGIESMPDGGEMIIKTESTEHSVLIHFIDQGSGIGESTLAKLGQPFFTTKEKGTGLGLATSFNIIENHHGEIAVESKVGFGTSFIIKLPLVKEMELVAVD
ncbi:PAS domain S-box protein [Bacillus sp. 31A1R]|uniref:histidine kinase n=1 Tax=Robertmurraya mangrovi TaxID=3098077 RepID=A0ABU5J310_9BACI|nr:PAS domain S-box protein [Bacillus sp. 31A1R]MDZ5473737.1 PAS domain S-box protein [Bacillus sp. 31A1R]